MGPAPVAAMAVSGRSMGVQGSSHCWLSLLLTDGRSYGSRAKKGVVLGADVA